MKILLTGGCGYIGSRLTEALLADGHRVTVVDAQWFGNHLQPHPALTVIQADVRDAGSLPFASQDAVLHLANVANDPCSDLNPKLSWEVNALATMGLVEAAIAARVPQFIYASSGSVYGVSEEPQVTEELPLLPISDYNKTKMVSERILLSYRDRITLQCIRPATVCGVSPRMRLDLSVNMLTIQALTKGHITVLGGAQVRPNITLKDMVRVYQHFLALGDRAPGIFNAGFENLSILAIARMVTAVVPAEIEVQPSNDPRSYRLNSDKLLATGFAPRFRVADAIEEVVAAYRAGSLQVSDQCYNVATMKQLAL
ncbi:MAG: SDR family oxidoreductase [Acidobacteria bacterium]|nr:SDR family oxidoreductase [Acidobacteriota bacterium]